MRFERQHEAVGGWTSLVSSNGNVLLQSIDQAKKGGVEAGFREVQGSGKFRLAGKGRKAAKAALHHVRRGSVPTLPSMADTAETEHRFAQEMLRANVEARAAVTPPPDFLGKQHWHSMIV